MLGGSGTPAALPAPDCPVVMKPARGACTGASGFGCRRNVENAVEAICEIIETGGAQGLLFASGDGRPPW